MPQSGRAAPYSGGMWAPYLSSQIPARLWSAALALLCLLAPVGAAAQASRPEVTWYVFNVAPMYILDGPNQGQGLLDQALRSHIIPALGGYTHKVVEAPFARLELMLKSEPGACVMGLLKRPDREEYMQFSQPFLAQFPPGVLVGGAAISRVEGYLERNGRLSLVRLLAESDLTVGVAGTRSYGAVIDGLLKPYQGKKNLFVSTASNTSSSLLQMALLGRVDLVPGYPYEARFQGISTAGRGQGGLRFYPLAEQPDFVMGHAACARSPQGAAVIHQVDALLARPGVRDAMAGYYARWLDEDSRRAERELRRHAFAMPPTDRR